MKLFSAFLAITGILIITVTLIITAYKTHPLAGACAIGLAMFAAGVLIEAYRR